MIRIKIYGKDKSTPLPIGLRKTFLQFEGLNETSGSYHSFDDN